MKKFIQNLSFIAAGVACFYIAYITGTGEILNYIDFADPLNEMGFFACRKGVIEKLKYPYFKRLYFSFVGITIFG